jgi:hypothetical protein
VTLFGELEAALDAAAHRHYERRWHVSWRPVAAVAVLAGVAAPALLSPSEATREAVPAQAPGVPAVTIELSHALTLAPATVPLRPEVDVPVPHAQLPAVAAEYERRTPYPPGRRDTFDWAGTPADPQDMSSINYRRDIQGLVEFRAGCLWMRYWLTGSGVERAAATRVLADIPAWPSRRAQPGSARELAARAAAGDIAAIAERVRTDCAGM